MVGMWLERYLQVSCETADVGAGMNPCLCSGRCWGRYGESVDVVPTLQIVTLPLAGGSGLRAGASRCQTQGDTRPQYFPW